MNYIAIYEGVKTLVKAALTFVDFLDESFPEGTKGRAKMDALEALIHQGVGLEENVAPVLEKAWPLAKNIVNAVLAEKKAIAALKSVSAVAA